MPNKLPSAVIFGCSGTVLTDAEKDFFKNVDPLGFILFARNVETPAQVKNLVASLRETVGRENAPVLIDQEGGRVRRLRPPHWKDYPAQGVFGRLYDKNPAAACEAAHLNARLIGRDLRELGIDVDCLPLLDVPSNGAHDVIGDRAFSTDARAVADLGMAVCEGLLDEGVMPIVKHVPGHGRARCDSHLALPKVEEGRIELENVDFYPFRHLASAPWAMTAHLLYTAIDARKPASLSKTVIDEVIRGYIGFKGFLICDDLSMKALEGGLDELTRQALDAGCDAVLHCNGNPEEMRAVASAVRPLTGAASERLARSFSMREKSKNKMPPVGTDEATDRIAALLAEAQ